MTSTLRSAALWWAALWAGYVGLVSRRTPLEVSLGALAAAPAAALGVAAARVGGVRPGIARTGWWSRRSSS